MLTASLPTWLPPQRRWFALLVLVVCGGLGTGSRQAAAQPAASPGYVVLAAGWNLISTAGAQVLDVPSADPTLFTLQPGDISYEGVDWQHLSPGDGYWVHLNANTAVRLPSSAQSSYRVDAPAGQWVMIGNPSTSASARVTGADQSLVYSALSGTFRADTLVPVGAGAFVYSRQGGVITIAVDPGDATPIDFAACCVQGTGDFSGKAQVEIANDTPYSVIYGLRAVSEDGTFPPPQTGNYAYGAIGGCAQCTEYDSAPTACRADAPLKTLDLTPGAYLIRLNTDAALVPDIVLTEPLAANTSYFFCRYVLSGRT